MDRKLSGLPHEELEPVKCAGLAGNAAALPCVGSTSMRCLSDHGQLADLGEELLIQLSRK